MFKFNIQVFGQRIKALYFAENFFRFSLILALIFLFFSSFFLFWQRNELPPEVPLFYSRPWGEEQLAPSFFLWLLPSFSGVIFLLNWILAAILYRQEEKLLARFLVVIALITNMFSSITLFKIITLMV